METRKQNIIAWFIVWASLLLLVLYSPIGSPDLYSLNSIYVITQKVDLNPNSFSKTTTVNSKTGDKNSVNSINIPAYSVQPIKRTAYARNKAEHSNNENYSLPAISTNNLSIQSNQRNSSSTGPENIGISKLRSNEQKSYSYANTSFKEKNLISTSTDLTSLADDNLTRQGSDLLDENATTDPGDDPFGSPIPVPDGWGFLLVLAGLYVVLKKYFFN